MKLPKTFIGWTNIKFIIKELVKMGSHQESFFSLKRFQIIVAFITYINGSMWYLHNKIDKMDATEFILWASPLLLICGYTLSALQKEKVDLKILSKDNIINEETK